MRTPVNPDLFARTAPAWNCVTGDGPHYTPGRRCEWCGLDHAAVRAALLAAAADAAECENE